MKSDTIERKFINSIDLSDFEIETDNGWQPLTTIHKTVPYRIWKLRTISGLVLNCADTHILFDSDFNEIFVKDIIKNKTEIMTKNGPELVVEIFETPEEENMYDLTVDHPDHRFYTNDILSHNTSIINGLSYALFEKPIGNVKKDNLVNNTNEKNMMVTVTFEKNGNDYKIVRGRKPNITKLYINSTDYEESMAQGETRDTQEEINHILGISHEMFKQVVALNATETPFLSMRAAQQREIIEELLGITLLSEKAEILRNQIKETQNFIDQEFFKVETIRNMNVKTISQIERLVNQSKKWENDKSKNVSELSNTLSDLMVLDIQDELKKHELYNEYMEHNRIINDNIKEKNTIQKKLELEKKAKINLENKLKVATNEKKCYTCGQPIDENHQDLLSALENELTTIANTIAELENDLSKIVIEIPKELPKLFYANTKDAWDHDSTVNNLATLLEKEMNTINPYNEQMENLKNENMLDIDETKLNDLRTTKDHQEFLLKVLTNKDSFVRKKIIDQSLPYLNFRLDHYLKEIGLPHNVKFQNDLSVSINMMGKDLDFDNLSRGQKTRLIIALNFAFRDVFESIHFPINLVFVDELIDNGIDTIGIDNSVKLLKDMARNGKSIILVSHKEEVRPSANNILKVVLENGFSSVIKE
jgi:DNA repair exonuclease SbcCD ATPase subunit